MQLIRTPSDAGVLQGRLLVGRGGLALRGSTLEKLANTFMTFITMFAQTTDGSSVGPELLKRQVSSVGQRDSRGAFVRKTLKDSIKDAVSSGTYPLYIYKYIYITPMADKTVAIESFDLAKEQLPRYWFGLNETKMLVNYLLRNAAASPSKADAKIQLAIAMLISFLMGVRVGSIAPSYQPWATESRVRHFAFAPIGTAEDFS